MLIVVDKESVWKMSTLACCKDDVPWGVTVVSEVDCVSRTSLEKLGLTYADVIAFFGSSNTILFPRCTAYWSARTVINKEYNWYPLFIVVPLGESALERLWSFLKLYPSFTLWIRSGGHSNLIVDTYTIGIVLSHLNHVVLHSPNWARSGSVSCGGGTLQGALYRAILNGINDTNVDPTDQRDCFSVGLDISQQRYDLHVSHQRSLNNEPAEVYTTLLGNAATVGIVAVMCGGGVGALYRLIGLAMDNVIQCTISTPAFGSVLCRPDASTQLGRDLFSAQLGSAGANFGIVTHVKMALRSVPNWVLQFELALPIENQHECVALISTLLEVGIAAPRAVVLEIAATHQTGSTPIPPRLRLYGSWYGAPADADVLNEPWFTPFLIAAPSATYSQIWQTYTESSVEQAIYPYFPYRFTKTWFLFHATTTPDLIDTTAVAMQVWTSIQDSLPVSQYNIRRGITLRCMGGAILDTPNTERYFAARHARIFGIFSIYWSAQRYATLQYAWLNSIWSPLRPYALQASGVPLSYSNFPFADPDWLNMFYGDNNRVQFLRTVKTIVDPTNLIQTDISIPPIV